MWLVRKLVFRRNQVPEVLKFSRRTRWLSPVRDQHSNLAKCGFVLQKAGFQTVKCPRGTLLWRLLSKSDENTRESWLVWLLAFRAAVNWPASEISKPYFLIAVTLLLRPRFFCSLFLYYSYVRKLAYFHFFFQLLHAFLSLYTFLTSLSQCDGQPLPPPPPPMATINRLLSWSHSKSVIASQKCENTYTIMLLVNYSHGSVLVSLKRSLRAPTSK